jgi:hypothetical protein
VPVTSIQLHDTCSWDAQLQAATDKVVAKAKSLGTLLRGRGESWDGERIAALVLLRPT